MSYERFLQVHAGVPEDLTTVLRDQMLPIWGAGWDAIAAIHAADWELPPDLLRRQARRELERAVLELRSSGFNEDSTRQPSGAANTTTAPVTAS